jgi:hypothetical protein
MLMDILALQPIFVTDKKSSDVTENAAENAAPSCVV